MNLSIEELYGKVAYWHGTGRYKYAEDGSITDVLAGIIADKGLVPHEDDWDRKRGKIYSISLARSRMYARLYAGMHMPNGERIRNELGSRYLWGYYFFGTAKLVAFYEYPFKRHVPGYWRKIKVWTGKISKRKHSLASIFLEGTDIADNYPILIGINRGTIHPADGSRFFVLHETRSEKPIAMSDLTHFEVPTSRVQETTAMLHAAGFNTPVIPIERGEAYCHQFSFWQLASGRPLAQATMRKQSL